MTTQRSSNARGVDSRSGNASNPDDLDLVHEVLRRIAEESKGNGTDRLTPGEIDRIISASRAERPAVLTADEVAVLLRVERKTVYAAFKTGEIPGGKRIGSIIRFSREAILRWLATESSPPGRRGRRK